MIEPIKGVTPKTRRSPKTHDPEPRRHIKGAPFSTILQEELNKLK